MQVVNLKQLRALVGLKKSVICPFSRFFKKPIPAAWIYQMTGKCILDLFEVGMYIYAPIKKKRGDK